MEHIRKTETMGAPTERACEYLGKRVMHTVFGVGTVIGLPKSQEGFIVQFDAVVTPRTLSLGNHLKFAE